MKTTTTFNDKSLTMILDEWDLTRATLKNDALKLIEKFESSIDFSTLDIIDLWKAMSECFDENGYRNNYIC